MSLDLKRQLVAQLVESSRLLRNYIDHRSKERGTTRAQWIVLFRLRQSEGLSQVDLADVLELQPISLVLLLDRLVEHGLLERPHDPKDRRANRLFLTAKGDEFGFDEMTALVKRYVDQADLGKKGSCHLFRHTMATLMLENGADIRFIQQMLGHAKLDTTQIYTQVSIRKLK